MKTFLLTCIAFSSAYALSHNTPTHTQITIESQARSFGGLVEAYSKGRQEYNSQIYDILEKYRDSETVVLDLGCGTGRSTRPLFNRFKEVYGIDHDPRMLEYARKDSPYAKQYIEGSAYNIPFEDEKFGLVSIACAFHWFFDVKALKEISRVLEQNGYLYVIRAGRAPFSKEPEEIIASISGVTNVAPHRDIYLHPTEFLSDNGYRIIENLEMEYEASFSLEEAIENCQSRSLWNFVKEVGKEKEALAQIEAFFKSKLNEHGLIVGTAPATLILVQKI